MAFVELIHKLRVEPKASWIELDSEALRKNVSFVKQIVGSRVSILAVVKANAYGHGLLEMASLLKDQVSFFGVAVIDDALLLRSSGIDHPILLLGWLTSEETQSAIQNDISLALSSIEMAQEISECARVLGKAARVHVKIDTGMGRLGIPAREALGAVAQIHSLEGLELEGIFTHFAQSEIPNDPFTLRQIELFQMICLNASRLGINFPFCHASNSAGTINYPEAHLNLVRTGLILYGVNPSPERMNEAADLHLRPVLSWRARIALVKRIEAGESVGYGRTFTAEKKMLICVLPVGYSQGYPYSLSNKGGVLVRGERCPIIGRVSMDHIVADLSSIKVGPGPSDTATLLGVDGEERITCPELARLAGTIPYEIFTRISPNLSRVVVGDL